MGIVLDTQIDPNITSLVDQPHVVEAGRVLVVDVLLSPEELDADGESGLFAEHRDIGEPYYVVLDARPLARVALYPFGADEHSHGAVALTPRRQHVPPAPQQPETDAHASHEPIRLVPPDIEDVEPERDAPERGESEEAHGEPRPNEAG